eukprot:TRINITY_DN1197_c0_g1_i4.p1 TRINITY_DN1197_c0_g1~~TRINITY_DN1197_c0_g1_i4.p1  ORF type:complete len:112 (+),score=1.77 TRINITY_DN1197_c0_g1_i4:132-467(+)
MLEDCTTGWIGFCSFFTGPAPNHRDFSAEIYRALDLVKFLENNLTELGRTGPFFLFLARLFSIIDDFNAAVVAGCVVGEVVVELFGYYIVQIQKTLRVTQRFLEVCLSLRL